MELFILWILLGVATAIVASNKGRSGCAWFAVGVLTGPIGLLIALVVAEDRARLEKASLAQGDMRKCPYCAELIRSAAVKCRYCGSEVPERDTAGARTREADASGDGARSGE